MATLLRTSTLIVSIDLAAGALPASARPLLDTLTEAGVAATWGVASASDWKSAAQLLGEDLQQELAILGRAAWTKATTGRERFAQELALHIAAADHAGYQPSTLTLTDGNIAPYADLAQKQGITAVRTAATVAPLSGGVSSLVGMLIGRSNTANRAYQPATLRFGVWDLRPSALWPHPIQPEATRLPVGALRRELDAAIESIGVFHLAIDAMSFVQAGDTARRDLEKFLQHADRRRRQTRLAILPLGELASKLSSPRCHTHARSILRARAA